MTIAFETHRRNEMTVDQLDIGNTVVVNQGVFATLGNARIEKLEDELAHIKFENYDKIIQIAPCLLSKIVGTVETST